MAATGFKMADFGQKIHTRTYKIWRSSVNMASNHLKFYGEHRYMLKNRKIATLLEFSGLSCCFEPSFQITKIDRKWKFWLFFVVYKGETFPKFIEVSVCFMWKIWCYLGWFFFISFYKDFHFSQEFKLKVLLPISYY